jgi:threonine synthase
VLETGGASLTVSDAEILEGQACLARSTGIFAEPAAAAAAAGLVKVQAGPAPLPREAMVVILATGHGLKDVEAPLSRIQIPAAIEPRLEAVPG